MAASQKAACKPRTSAATIMSHGGVILKRYAPRHDRVRARRSGAIAMITVPELAADALGKFLATYMRRRFGTSQTHLTEMVPSIARIAIECIGNSDALYHNVEYTMLVTRHPARPRAAHPHAGRGLCARHHRLRDPRHRLCPRPVWGRRQG